MRSRHLGSHAIVDRITDLLRRPSSAMWLSQVRLKTNRFDEAIDFYANVLGLSVDDITIEPKSGLPHARFLNGSGEQTVVIEETPVQEGTTSNVELTFSMPLRSWYLLRARLQTRDYQYEELETGRVLHLEDPDGTRIRVNALSNRPIEATTHLHDV